MTTDNLECDIFVQAGAWPALPYIEDIVKHALNHVKFDAGEYCEVSIVLTDDHHIQQLNSDYRDKDKPTNVLSFPQDEDTMLGDIIIALETIQREAEEQNKSFDNHLKHMLVHSVLHLLGYDHMTPEEAKEMETLEIEILAALNIKNPYEI